MGETGMGETGHDRAYHRIAGHRVLVFVPRRPPPLRVMTFLHGRGEAAADEAGKSMGDAPERMLERHGPPAYASGAGEGAAARNARAALADVLLICPQRDRLGPWQEADADWVMALEDSLVAEHGGDRSRHHLTGFSWGGAGVTRFASRADCAGRWRGLWIVDPNPEPAVTPVPPAARPAMLHFGTHFDAAAMAAWRRRAGFTGRFAPNALRADRGLALGHVETAREAYGEAEAWDWLAGWENTSGTVS